jgi:hypothetical protein
MWRQKGKIVVLILPRITLKCREQLITGQNNYKRRAIYLAVKTHSTYKNIELKIEVEGVEMKRILSPVFRCQDQLRRRGDNM